MKTTDEAGGAAATPTDTVAVSPTPRPRTRRGKGTITHNVGIPKAKVDGRSKEARAKRTPSKIVRRTRRSAVSAQVSTNVSLVQDLLAKNGFTGTGTFTYSEGRKSLVLPLGLFTGK